MEDICLHKAGTLLIHNVHCWNGEEEMRSTQAEEMRGRSKMTVSWHVASTSDRYRMNLLITNQTKGRGKRGKREEGKREREKRGGKRRKDGATP
jgi:hypothetical protein